MNISTKGYVLHRRAYRETSALVDVLTPEHGRLSFVAKGLQRQKNPLKASLQPMQLLQLELFGKHSLKTLRQAEPIGTQVQLVGKHLYSLFYINEILVRVMEQDLAVDGVFEDYHQVLQQLYQKQKIEPLLRRFELNLLQHLGYGVDCFSDNMGRPIENDQQWFQFIPDSGFVVSTTATSNRQYSFQGHQICAIRDGDWQASALRDAKRLNRLAMYPLLGDKPLHSKSLFINLE